MAHFAKINEDNIVEAVVVVSNDDLLDAKGIEQEQQGIEVCNNVLGSGRWVQTSFNASFRKTFAHPGYFYDQELDIFYNPTPPHPSWTLDENFDFQPPVAKPASGIHIWDEPTLSWIQLPS
ncbi:MAG: hypothetical protein O2981_05375 [Proteobacteria bacterium]|nr:hypothetical protein [Pseudomonadota bacterium]